MGGSLGEHTFAYHLAPLRAAPDEEAEQVSQILPGEPVAIEEEREGWARVRTAYDYPGWVPAAALGGKPDAGWLVPRVSEPLEHARSLLGASYEWGGMTSAGIDCSGLVHMSYRAAGRLVPRDADQQARAGRRVVELRPGDLIAYGDPVDHVAFALGDGRILHATRRDGVDGVVEEPEPDELRSRRRAVFQL